MNYYPKENKYRNEKFFGFDSMKEANRYAELHLMERAGIIANLQRQVKFELIPAQYKDKKLVERACYYVADFTYMRDGVLHVEDVKGYKGGGAYSVFSIKRKLMYATHGIQVEEI